MHPPRPDSAKSDLDTPLLCVDRDVMEANIAIMIGTCRQHGVGWRPHTKSHKSPDIAQLLLKAGAHGITCAKLGEAEVMAAGGVRDILIANMIVGPQKLKRLVELRRIADPITCVDDAAHVQALSEAASTANVRLRVMIEIDIGLNRVGCQPDEPTLALAKQIDQAAGLELAGIMGYEGHLLQNPDPVQKEKEIADALAILNRNRLMLEEAGMACPIVSCGGTGSFAYAVKQPGITELQAGGGMFMDAFYRHKCQVDAMQFAMTVITTIVSRPTPERAIIDAGRKTMDGTLHLPLVVGRDDVHVERLSAEHGQLRLEPSAFDLRIGDRLEIIPGYSDLTCVLHDHLVAFRGDRVDTVWPIAGRGKLQ